MRKSRLWQRVRPVAVMCSAGFRADPVRAIATLVMRSAVGLSGPAVAAALAALVASAGRGVPMSRSVASAAILAFAVGARVVLNEITWKITHVLQERTVHLVDCEIVSLVASLPDVEHLERAEHLDRIDRLRAEREAFAWTVSGLINFFVAILTTVTTIGMLAAVDARLLLLPLFVIPSIVTGAKVERMRRQTMEEHESDWRHVYDLNTLATSPAAGKEIRIFGLADEIHRRHVETMRDIRRWSLAIGMSDAKLTSAARSVFTLGYVGAIALVAWRVGTHQAPVSQLVLTVVLAGQVMGMLASLTGEAREFAWNIASVRRYVWFLDYAKEHKARHGGIAAPASLSSGITFESIDFTYPGTTNPVLTDVNLDIAPGSIVAIVGDNGAGKTTLVKLLSRLYQPSSGRITVDGTDLADYDIESWRARFGAAFQDHARLELVAQRAIGVGDMPHLDDTKAATEALQRAAAHNVLNDLPQRLETQLGTSWMDGVELSGGQWQKIALGRGMMRETPLVLVLDEPTAALDAETEHRLFERYARAAGEAGARAGTITVLVSHRFSTVRMADVIVVIDGGHIVETGGHDELVRRGGLYAQLYELQARAYR